MRPEPLATVEIEPSRPAEAVVVLLHGLGADGHDLEPIPSELRLAASPALRWVLPHAPVRPVTINAGARMRAWYDVTGFDRRAREDEAGIRESAEAVRGLLERERARGVPADRIVLAGFSQGGAMALFTGLRERARLAGVVALSGYLPAASTLAQEAHPANAAVPIFMAHGSLDPVVPISLGEASRDLLRSRGYEVDWHAYPMPHSLSADELADLRSWLLRALGATA